MKQFVDMQTADICFPPLCASFRILFIVLMFVCPQEPSLSTQAGPFLMICFLQTQYARFGPAIDLPSSRYAQLATQRVRKARNDSKRRTWITSADMVGRYWEMGNTEHVIDFHCKNFCSSEKIILYVHRIVVLYNHRSSKVSRCQSKIRSPHSLMEHISKSNSHHI